MFGSIFLLEQSQQGRCGSKRFPVSRTCRSRSSAARLAPCRANTHRLFRHLGLSASSQLRRSDSGFLHSPRKCRVRRRVVLAGGGAWCFLSFPVARSCFLSRAVPPVARVFIFGSRQGSGCAPVLRRCRFRPPFWLAAGLPALRPRSAGSQGGSRAGGRSGRRLAPLSCG